MAKLIKGKNDLATVRPDLAKEWHPTKNDGLLPTDVTAGSGKKVWWLCPLGHEYQATIHDRNRSTGGTRCPICRARAQTSFPEQAILFYVKKLYPDAVSKYKDIFERTMELDIYIPSIRLGIEFDGAHWHNSSDQFEREKRNTKYAGRTKSRLLELRKKQYHSGMMLQMQFIIFLKHQSTHN